MSDKDLKDRWPSADRAAMIDDEGIVHGFDRTDDDEVNNGDKNE